MMPSLMALSIFVSFVFVFAVVFQLLKAGTRLFYLAIVILSPFLALACYQAIDGLFSFSMNWLILIVLVVVVSVMVANRLWQ